MKKILAKNIKSLFTNIRFFYVIIFILFIFIIFVIDNGFFTLGKTSYGQNTAIVKEQKDLDPIPPVPKFPPLDTILYDFKIKELANNPPPKEPTTTPPSAPLLDQGGAGLPAQAGGGNLQESTPVPAPKPTLWPVKTAYPIDGAILPFNRIIAYYGNLYSKRMGVLGEYEEDVMLKMLDNEVKKWEAADPNTPVIPALHYIAVTAQLAPGEDGKYRLRMPDKEIDKVLIMAEKIPARAGGNAIVFLDIQVGFSNVQVEVPRLEKYLKMPNVHLGLDPEFSMKSGIRPGKVVGTMDATDINFVTEYLAKIVKENNLPPKILVIHRYTQKMFTNYNLVKILPEVQIVMHMDGWGGAAKKRNTYQQFIYKEPVHFTGFKIFYKNDILEKGTILMTPEDLLKLNPRPSYIQYQ